MEKMKSEQKLASEIGGAGAMMRGGKSKKRKTFLDYQEINPRLPSKLKSYLMTASLTSGTRALKRYREAGEIPGQRETYKPRRRRRKTGIIKFEYKPGPNGR